MYQVDTSKGYSLGGLEQIGYPDLLNWPGIAGISGGSAQLHPSPISSAAIRLSGE